MVNELGQKMKTEGNPTKKTLSFVNLHLPKINEFPQTFQFPCAHVFIITTLAPEKRNTIRGGASTPHKVLKHLRTQLTQIQSKEAITLL